MAMFDTLLTSEIARRRKIGAERTKALSDPTKMQDLLAKGMKSQVPEGRKIKTKRYPTKLAATEAAIPKGDPRKDLGTASWSRYTDMLEDPKYKKFSPRDLLAASSELEFDKRREATHKYIQKQKTGTFSTFMKEEYAPMPGQEEWEAEHPPRIPHMRAEVSAAWGAGTKAAIEAGKFAFGKGPAAKIGRRKTIALLLKAGPYGKLAAAGVSAIAGFRVFEEVASRTTEQVKKTEYGKEHPVAAELIGMGAGLATGIAVPVEAMFGGMLTSKGGKAITKFQQMLKRKNTAGTAAMENPAAKEIIEFKKAEGAAAKSSDKAVAAVDKDKVATMKRLVDTLEGRVAKEKAAAMPMPGGTIPAVRGEVPPLAVSSRISGVPSPVAIARPGSIFTPTERVSGVPSKLKVPEKAIVIEQETPNLPMLKPDGSLSSLGSRKVVPYSYKDIKSEEGFDRVLSEVAGGRKKAVDAVQLVGEMDEGVIRHSKVIPTKKVTVVFKKKMSDLGYDAEEVAGMNKVVAANIETFSKKKEPSALLDRTFREPMPQKIESTFDLSGLPTEEKLYNWAKTLSPQKRLDLVERGTISEAVNRRIVKEQKVILEGKSASKEFIAKEAEADAKFLGSMGTGGVPKEDGSYLAKKADFLLGMKGDKGAVSPKILAGLAAGGTIASLTAPDKAEAMAFIGKLASITKAPLLKAMASTKSTETVRKETGWFKGLDNKWRFEIDDSKAEIAVDKLTTLYKTERSAGFSMTLLKDVIKHPTLFKAYPELRRLSIFFEEGVVKHAGYSRGLDSITINPKTVPIDKLKQVIMHETQHAIQYREKFAVGASISKDFSSYQRQAGEIEARATQRRVSMSAAERKAVLPYAAEMKELGITEKEVILNFERGAAAPKVLTGLAVGGALAALATPTWELLQGRETADKTVMEALTAAATTFTLADIFSPAEAEAAGIVDLGRTLSGLTATIAKDVKPGKVKGLVKEMKGSGLIAKSQVDHCYVLPEPRKSLNIIPNVKDVSKKKSMPMLRMYLRKRVCHLEQKQWSLLMFSSSIILELEMDKNL
jgi:hypothetical protein